MPLAILLVIGCCAGVSSSGHTQEGSPDWLIVPGERVGPIAADTGGLPEYGQVRGEKEFSSGHPAMQALDPGVYQMIIILSP